MYRPLRNSRWRVYDIVRDIDLSLSTFIARLADEGLRDCPFAVPEVVEHVVKVFKLAFPTAFPVQQFHPSQVSETLFKIFVEQRPAPRLKDPSLLPVKIGNQSVRCNLLNGC
jgi:hypothetical protein